MVRISESLDPSTQTHKVYVSIESKQLTDGSYVDGVISSESPVEETIALPLSIMNPDGSIFSVTPDSTLKKIFPEVVHSNRQGILVTGIPRGTILLKDALGSGYEGMPVTPVTAAE